VTHKISFCDDINFGINQAKRFIDFFHSTKNRKVIYVNKSNRKKNRFRFETAFWNKPGIMERESLLEMIGDKEALFCLGHDKIDRDLIERAKKLKIIGTVAI
jgi:lactate dehydrogenase-like 2-hydroxyacid dehydrogenase